MFDTLPVWKFNLCIAHCHLIFRCLCHNICPALAGLRFAFAVETLHQHVLNRMIVREPVNPLEASEHELSATLGAHYSFLVNSSIAKLRQGNCIEACHDEPSGMFLLFLPCAKPAPACNFLRLRPAWTFDA